MPNVEGREMEELDMEMEEFFREPFCLQLQECNNVDIDIDYEFDAPRFWDFTKAETELEAQETEFWFETASSYPTAPFAIKANWRPNIQVEDANEPSDDGDNRNSIRNGMNASTEHGITTTDDDSLGLKSDYHTVQDIAKSKVKSPVKSPRWKNSNFMNPTESQLAKHNCLPEIRCTRLLRRFNKLSVKHEEMSSRYSAIIGNHATKRQKLEAGYLRKAASLKHQTLFIHKKPKKVDDNKAFARPKATIPKEPVLKTASRAERHRSKVNWESAINAKSNASCTFRARPLNRKILKAPSVPIPRKSTPQQPDFQVFHLRTLERAMQHSSVNAANIPTSNLILQHRRANSTSKLEAPDKFKACCLNTKEPNSLTDKGFLKKPPIEEFSKLSLATEAGSRIQMQNEGSKENAPTCVHLEHEMMNSKKSLRLGKDRYRSGTDRRMNFIKPRINVNRSLDIR